MYFDFVKKRLRLDIFSFKTVHLPVTATNRPKPVAELQKIWNNCDGCVVFWIHRIFKIVSMSYIFLYQNQPFNSSDKSQFCRHVYYTAISTSFYLFMEPEWHVRSYPRNTNVCEWIAAQSHNWLRSILQDRDFLLHFSGDDYIGHKQLILPPPSALLSYFWLFQCVFFLYWTMGTSSRPELNLLSQVEFCPLSCFPVTDASHL